MFITEYIQKKGKLMWCKDMIEKSRFLEFTSEQVKGGMQKMWTA